jgi:hypothetical protein
VRFCCIEAKNSKIPFIRSQLKYKTITSVVLIYSSNMLYSISFIIILLLSLRLVKFANASKISVKEFYFFKHKALQRVLRFYHKSNNFFLDKMRFQKIFCLKMSSISLGLFFWYKANNSCKTYKTVIQQTLITEIKWMRLLSAPMIILP